MRRIREFQHAYTRPEFSRTGEEVYNLYFIMQIELPRCCFFARWSCYACSAEQENREPWVPQAYFGLDNFAQVGHKKL